VTHDRPLLGLLLILGFCVLAPLADAIAKLIGDAVPLLQLVTVRFAAQAILLVPLVLIAGLSLRVPRRLFGLLVARTVLHIVGVALIFLALRHMPLADTIAIAYVMPFIALLLGHLILKEEVGWRRMAACAVGFVGTMMVMQPSFEDVGWIAVLPMIVAVIFAVFMLLTRLVAKEIAPVELQAVNGLIGSALLLPLLWAFEGSALPELDSVWPSERNLWLMAAIGVLGTAAHLVLTWALRFAPTATLAPIQYLEIPMAVIVGLLLFAEFPDGLALVGIAVVMAAGLYIVWRERIMAQAPPMRSAEPPSAESR